MCNFLARSKDSATAPDCKGPWIGTGTECVQPKDTRDLKAEARTNTAQAICIGPTSTRRRVAGSPCGASSSRTSPAARQSNSACGPLSMWCQRCRPGQFSVRCIGGLAGRFQSKEDGAPALVDVLQRHHRDGLAAQSLRDLAAAVKDTGGGDLKPTLRNPELVA